MGPEIVIALQALRGAWAGIQYCCESLREGTVEIQRVKKTVEGGVADAKKIYAEVTGLWGWLKGLFAGARRDAPAPQAAATTAQPAASAGAEKVSKGAKKSARKDDGYVDHIPTQDEVVQQFIGHLGTWFENYAVLKAFTEKRYAEVFGKDEISNKDVLELTQLQAEVDNAYPTLSTLMSGAPWQLGPIWTQFKDMQDKVAAGQAARQMKQRREKANRDAIAAQARSDQIDRNIAVFYTGVLIFYFWLFMGLVWENAKTTH